MIVENKNLITTGNKNKKRYINFGLKEPFEDGIVTVIHQEQFNQLKKEFKQLKENDENPITEEDIKALEEKIEGLQKENQELKITNEEISEELERTSDKLELALNNDTVKQLNLQNDKRINDLKEVIDKKELEVKSYKDEVAEKEKEIKSLSVALTTIITNYENLISDYESIKNRNILERLMNSNIKEIAIEEVSDYKKLIEKKPVYIDTKLEDE